MPERDMCPPECNGIQKQQHECAPEQRCVAMEEECAVEQFLGIDCKKRIEDDDTDPDERTIHRKPEELIRRDQPGTDRKCDC